MFLSCSQSAKEKWYFYLKTYFAAVLLVPSSSSAQISADSLKSNGTQETLMFVRTRDNNMRSQLDFTVISIWQSIIFTTSNKPVLQRRFALRFVKCWLSRALLLMKQAEVNQAKMSASLFMYLCSVRSYFVVPVFKMAWRCVTGLSKFQQKIPYSSLRKGKLDNHSITPNSSRTLC